MKVLSEIIGNLRDNLKPENLFPVSHTITFRPKSHHCPRCRTTAKVLKTKTKPVATLAIGAFVAREFLYVCPRCAMVFGSDELERIVPHWCNIGYEVLVHVGEAFFLDSCNNASIVESLRKKNVTVCRSEVSYLAKKFIVYLALLHKQVQKETRAFLSINGGYILHLDGTCEGDSPHLISVLDGITEIVLDNTKVLSENADDLIAFLEDIKSTYGDPVAVVSDMGKGILAAFRDVFKDVPGFICHYHFLKALGKELFAKEHDIMRKRLSNHGIQGIVKKRIRYIESKTAVAPPQIVETLLGLIKDEEEVNAVHATEDISCMLIHTLLTWALAGKHQGGGRGFPFDQPYLVFYQRLVTAGSLLDRFLKSGFLTTASEKKLCSTIIDDLRLVIKDSMLKKTSVKMLEKVHVFARLRSAMRITLPENKRGLNDDGELCDMKTIEHEVRKFRTWLCKNKTCMKDEAYQKLIDQIDKYWDMLFCDPIVVETKAGNITIQPQRTNNLLERFFRSLMRTYRKKNDFQAMSRVLKAMLKDTPLVMNLRNKDFMDILLGDKESLAQRFADVDTEIVRKRMEQQPQTGYQLSAKLKKIIAAPRFPESLISLMDKDAS